MTVKELIDKLQQFDEDKLVLVEDTEYKEFEKAYYKLEDSAGDVLKENDIILKAGSNRAGFIKFDD